MTRNFKIISLLSCGAILVGCSSHSGPISNAQISSGGSSSRRAVKIAADGDASQINASPQDTTIEAIDNQKVPSSLSGREGPFETSVWKVHATVDSVQLMKDGDYYLVLKGDKGGRTVVEVPDPKLCKGSRFLSQITQARNEIEKKYHPTSQLKKVDDKATVTGVGFLGWGKSSNTSKKGATGYSGARLLPGLGIKFGP